MFTLGYYSVIIDSSFSESKQIHPSYILRERWDVLSWPSVFAPGSESKRNMFVNTSDDCTNSYRGAQNSLSSTWM